MSRLSSAWARAGIVAAGVVAAALLVAGVSVVLADDGGSRDDVSAYIDDVNEILREHAIQVDRLRYTYLRIRSNPGKLSDLRDRLEDGRRTLAALALRVRSLEPPEDAAVLHARLARLLDAQAAFAAEVVALADFLPTVAAQERSLGRAAARLRRDLRQSTPEAQASAFSRYARSVGVAAEGVAAADVPRSMRSSKRAKLDRLGEIEDSSRELADALATGRREDVVAAARQFGLATAASSANVERAATLAYNRERARVVKLAESVETERLRLSRELR